jgi:2-dehydro-3-deoxy-D-arabinonate dehydratase
MRLCKVRHPKLGVQTGIILEDSPDQVRLLSGSESGDPTLSAILHAEDPVRFIGDVLARCGRVGVDLPAVPLTEVTLLPPLDNQEVWAAGVTYIRSREARERESEGAARFYDLVYRADRPELFFKATARRVIGPGGAVRIRRDARWSVPEPELALVVSPSLRIVGYTIGNDMSSRDIEGENPLYLPQAKLYDGSCALGPVITLTTALPSVENVAIRLTIRRGQTVAFAGETALTSMKRTPEDLVSWLGRDNSFPDGVILLTGTGIVPPDDFTLAPGDQIAIAITGIGTLENVVEG